jgi:hypothetical protein
MAMLDIKLLGLSFFFYTSLRWFGSKRKKSENKSSAKHYRLGEKTRLTCSLGDMLAPARCQLARLKLPYRQ